MHRVLIILLLIFSAPALWAQGWTAEVSRDEIYDSGSVSMPGHMMTFACAARTGRANVTPNSRWWEVSVAPPWQYLIHFADPMVPNAPHEVQVQMTLFVDQTGYRLPIVHRNELEGGWQTMLSMSDPMFAAIAGASRLVLQVGDAHAWELPVAGLASGLEQAQQTCGGTWRGAAQPLPSNRVAQTAAGPDLRRAAETYAASTCRDFFTPGPNAIKMVNIDGDGIMDLVLDFNDITCDIQARRPNVCGASLCSIDVFLSRTYFQTGRPENLLGMSASIVPLSNGSNAVSTSGNLSMCGSVNGCAFLWYWNGAQFTELKQ